MWKSLDLDVLVVSSYAGTILSNDRCMSPRTLNTTLWWTGRHWSHRTRAPVTSRVATMWHSVLTAGGEVARHW